MTNPTSSGFPSDGDVVVCNIAATAEITVAIGKRRRRRRMMEVFPDRAEGPRRVRTLARLGTLLSINACLSSGHTVKSMA